MMNKERIHETDKEMNHGEYAQKMMDSMWIRERNSGFRKT